MSDITIMVPFDVVSALRLSLLTQSRPNCNMSSPWPLCQRGILSSGKACVLAGVNRWEWEALLGARKIPRHYTDEELNQDIAYATGGQ